MKKTFLLFAICAIALMIVACSSPEEKKLEKDTGYKLSEVNKALKVKEELNNLKNIIPTNLNEVQKLAKQYDELDKKIQDYKPIYQALHKFLYEEPQAYAKLFGKNKEYPEALFVKNIKNNPELVKITQDIKDFLNGLDKEKIKNHYKNLTFFIEPNPYREKMKEKYDVKLKLFIQKYKEVSKQFLETNQELSDKEKQSLDLSHCNSFSLSIYCHPVKIFGLEFPN